MRRLGKANLAESVAFASAAAASGPLAEGERGEFRVNWPGRSRGPHGCMSHFARWPKLC